MVIHGAVAESILESIPDRHSYSRSSSYYYEMSLLLALWGLTTGQLSGSGTVLQSARLVTVISGDTYQLKAPLTGPDGKTRWQLVAVSVESVRSPRRGEPGFAVAKQWAVAFFKKHPDVGGRTFNRTGSVPQADLAAAVPGKPMAPLVVSAELLKAGMARFDERQSAEAFRLSPTYKDYKRGMLSIERDARVHRRGLWGSVWRTRR